MEIATINESSHFLALRGEPFSYPTDAAYELVCKFVYGASLAQRLQGSEGFNVFQESLSHEPSSPKRSPYRVCVQAQGNFKRTVAELCRSI